MRSAVWALEGAIATTNAPSMDVIIQFLIFIVCSSFFICIPIDQIVISRSSFK